MHLYCFKKFLVCGNVSYCADAIILRTYLQYTYRFRGMLSVSVVSVSTQDDDCDCAQQPSVCGMCEAVVTERSKFLKGLRRDALECIGRGSLRRVTTPSDFINGHLTMRERAVSWYAAHLVQISRSECASREARSRAPKKRWLDQERSGTRTHKKLVPRDVLAMPLPASLWRIVADFALSPCMFLTYSASVSYIPRGALTDMLQDLCPESRNMWPVPRGPLDRQSHSTLRCPWISSGFVCPYLAFADKSYGRDVFHLTQARLTDVRLLRLMCRRIADCVTDEVALHATRRMENVHTRILQVQHARRRTAFVDYRHAIAMRQPFFTPAQLVGEPMRIQFTHAWALPPYLSAPNIVFVAVAHVSDACWECAVLRDDEFEHCLHHVGTSAEAYRDFSDSASSSTTRVRMARACEDMGRASGRRSIHMKATPYGDGYRIRGYFIRQPLHAGDTRQVAASSHASLRFMCLTRGFHLYGAYKRTTAEWKHKTQPPMPKAPCALAWKNIDAASELN